MPTEPLEPRFTELESRCHETRRLLVGNRRDRVDGRRRRRLDGYPHVWTRALATAKLAGVTRTQARVQRRRSEPRSGSRSASRRGSVARSAEEAVLQLQRLVGNAATSKALKVAAAPVPVTPGGPMTSNELGHTRVRGREMPKFVVNKDGVVSSTTKGSVDIEAEYVAAGVYDMGPNKYGPRKKLITPAMSDLVKQGEQEHADDIWFGHEIVAGEAAVRSMCSRAEGPGRKATRPTCAATGGPRSTMRSHRSFGSPRKLRNRPRVSRRCSRGPMRSARCTR